MVFIIAEKFWYGNWWKNIGGADGDVVVAAKELFYAASSLFIFPETRECISSLAKSVDYYQEL